VSAELTALHAALAGEHAALFAYGVVGGRSAGPDAELAAAAYVRHRARRDALVAMLTEAGELPDAPEVAYDLPFALDKRAALRRLAGLLERRCAALYAALVQQSPDARAFAAEALVDCATTQLSWGDAPEPFPGLGS
jgi:hypothetical protein